MRFVSFFTVLIIVLTGQVLANTDATFSFDYNQLDRASKKYFIEIDAQSSISDFDYFVKNSSNYYFSETEFNSDIPTSDDRFRTEQIEANIKKVVYENNPVKFLSEIKINNSRYLQVLISPVTVDNLGQAVFNQDIYITRNNVIVPKEELFTLYDIHKHTSKNASYNFSLSVNVEYVIVTSEKFAKPLAELAAYKNQTGIIAELKYIDDILREYSGRDDAEKLREYLKDFYNQGGVYVLLAGDETVLPIRYAYNLTAITEPSLELQQVCDLYFSDLTGEWDKDNDNVWGEVVQDEPDIVPELKVGRLPFNTVKEFQNYVEKLIIYETNPGNGDLTYLKNSLFISADQMRDFETGQHNLIAEAYPQHIDIDTVSGVEAATGFDLSPTNISANELETVISDGFGIVNIIVHGSNSNMSIRTSGYNNWPKSFFTSDSTLDGPGHFTNFEENNKVSFYYSLACDNGGFDLDQSPMNQTGPNAVQTLLGLEKSGAVGFVAYSRWGWIKTSYLLQKSFFNSLFNNPGRPAIDAMYDSKIKYDYYRDLIYGQNFYGDPTMIIYTDQPKTLSIVSNIVDGLLNIDITSNDNPVENCKVVISRNNQIVDVIETGVDGTVQSNVIVIEDDEYIISAVKNGYCTTQEAQSPSIVTAVDDDRTELPLEYQLFQNYPNPFNPITSIKFGLARQSSVKLEVYNITGQKVKTLANYEYSAGQYEIEWNATNENNNQVSSGIYFYKLETDSFTDVKKMVLLK